MEDLLADEMILDRDELDQPRASLSTNAPSERTEHARVATDDLTSWKSLLADGRRAGLLGRCTCTAGEVHWPEYRCAACLLKMWARASDRAQTMGLQANCGSLHESLQDCQSNPAWWPDGACVVCLFAAACRALDAVFAAIQVKREVNE